MIVNAYFQEMIKCYVSIQNYRKSGILRLSKKVKYFLGKYLRKLNQIVMLLIYR